MQQYFRVASLPAPASFGILVLRVVSGVALVLHAVPKLENPTGWMTDVPFPEWAMALAAFAEFVGGLLLVLGLATPVAALLVLGVMSGALYYHLDRGDPLVRGYELAAMHFATALLVLLAGPGRASADAFLFGRKGG